MQKTKVAIDVDLVLTSVDIRWYDYLIEHYKAYLDVKQYLQFCEDYENGVAKYNLSEYFNLPDHVNPMEFWEQDNLYDNEVLKDGAYEVVKNLYEAGLDIYFLSYCNFPHIPSKYQFLKRSFDFMEDIKFVATRDKCCMNGSADIVIDDRASNLVLFTEETLRIMFDSPYEQDVELTLQHKVAKSWNEVEDIICNYLENN